VSAPILTIGYEAASLDAVLAALGRAGAAILLDVRAVASSRKPGFSKTLLCASVEARGMRYAHLRGLGTPKPGRQAVRRGDVAGMRAIFAEHMRSDAAQADLARAAALAAEGPACLLCFERDHATCHRAIVAELIAERSGQAVVHLTAALDDPGRDKTAPS
jgi:uncharacterized protein (DUF488 family)